MPCSQPTTLALKLERNPALATVASVVEDELSHANSELTVCPGKHCEGAGVDGCAVRLQLIPCACQMRSESIKESEMELMRRHEQMKRELEEQQRMLEQRKAEFEMERRKYEAQLKLNAGKDEESC